jgi:hypothetical protein
MSGGAFRDLLKCVTTRTIADSGPYYQALARLPDALKYVQSSLNAPKLKEPEHISRTIIAINILDHWKPAGNGLPAIAGDLIVRLGNCPPLLPTVEDYLTFVRVLEKLINLRPDLSALRTATSSASRHFQLVRSVLIATDQTIRADFVRLVQAAGYGTDPVQLLAWSYALRTATDADYPLCTPDFVVSRIGLLAGRTDPKRQPFLRELIVHVLVSLQSFFQHPDAALSVVAHFIKQGTLLDGFAQGPVCRGLLAELMAKLPPTDSPAFTLTEQISVFLSSAGQYLNTGDSSYVQNVRVFFEKRKDAPAFSLTIKALAHERGSEVVVLIDDCDAPILRGVFSGDAEIEAGVVDRLHGALGAADDFLRLVLAVGRTTLALPLSNPGRGVVDNVTMMPESDGLCGFDDEEIEEYFSDRLEELVSETGFASSRTGLERALGAASGTERLKAELKADCGGYGWYLGVKRHHPGAAFAFCERKFFDVPFQGPAPPNFVEFVKKNRKQMPNWAERAFSISYLESVTFHEINLAPLMFQLGYLTVDSVKFDGLDYLCSLGFPNERAEAAYRAILSD